MENRSGRFKSKVAIPDTKPQPIVVAKKGDAVYRIWNSGPVDLTVHANNETYPVQTTHSMDISTAGTIAISGDANVEGIYDYLRETVSVRSGRFKFRNATATPKPISHPVVVLENSSSAYVYYRFFNSSDEETFSIFSKKGNGQPEELVKDLKSGDSVDLAAGKGESLLIVASVKASVDGIYEFLGTGS